MVDVHLKQKKKRKYNISRVWRLTGGGSEKRNGRKHSIHVSCCIMTGSVLVPFSKLFLQAWSVSCLNCENLTLFTYTSRGHGKLIV